MKNNLKKFLIFVLCAMVNILILSMCAFASDKLEVHYIDVGQADAILIKAGAHNMMIDGGNADDSQRIYTYLKDQGVKSFDYIINSHGDEDHVGGLSAAVQEVNGNVGMVLAPYKVLDKDRFNIFVSKLAEFNKEITVPKAGQIYKLGDATFQILSAGGTGNNESLVIRLSYGNNSFLFTGDAPEDQEKEIVKSGFDVESDVLKVAHHGSNTSTCYQFLRAANPSIAVISVGKDNSYGHPTDAVLSRLRDADAKIYRTDNNGTIVITSDGKTITVQPQKDASDVENLIPGGTSSANAEVDDTYTGNVTGGSSQEYILNIKSKKIHVPSCTSVGDMKEKNKKAVTDTIENLMDQGYDPCKKCLARILLLRTRK